MNICNVQNIECNTGIVSMSNTTRVRHRTRQRTGVSVLHRYIIARPCLQIPVGTIEVWWILLCVQCESTLHVMRDCVPTRQI
ncbi:hypothetical protein JHK85_011223 [Glycine max]|uniref:Uncharacterized protein n=2 Tax=Glycine subgen. Soja TaxID=1462606 RepID=A0A0R0KHC8_SOYBN|nr:hypothetical protein JHK85_011223 [Glycine max]KAH1112445.1 hypothetical protein GYH30_010621 [Glycine max]RZC17585.1 hypothetical protein D0Y65_010374 [Glycine soja]